MHCEQGSTALSAHRTQTSDQVFTPMMHDQFVYRQATRVSGVGVIIQSALALLLLVFGNIAGDTGLVLAGLYVATGILSWTTLAVLFHQHKLERVETLENEEVALSRGGAGSVFDGERVENQAAARRLRLMHQWLAPIASVLVAAMLGLLCYGTLAWLARQDAVTETTTFRVGAHLGWQLALCTALSLVTFIFSRFVAGMAKQSAWQNLRGGAGVMVGNALVLLALAVGTVFQVFKKEQVLEAIAYGIAIYAGVIAAEILLNLILNLYRPRKVTDTPRPAFDSKLLGLAAAPDSIVRSINEAVNYQFGFDITSSWGYQLLLRSVLRLCTLGVAVLLIMSMIVVVQPSEQAVRLRGGKVIGEVAQGSLLFKWPWPFESVERYDVGQIRTLVLGGKLLATSAVNLWPVEGEPDTERLPFIVLASSRQNAASGSIDVGAAATPAASAADAAALANQFALIDADIVLEYRVRADGLLDYLQFCTDAKSRGSALDTRERTLKAIAMREASQLFSTRSIDQVLSPTGDSLVRQLTQRVQGAFDRSRCGVEVVGILLPVLRPPAGEAAGMFEELSIDVQNARKIVDEANRMLNVTLSTLAGSPQSALSIVAAIERLQSVEKELGSHAPAAREQRAAVEKMILDARAQAASVISSARAKRWDTLMRARTTSSEVLGQAAAYHTAPEIYRERAIMAVLTRALAAARIKYVLAVDPARIEFDVQMEQPEPGLNLGDYLEKKE